MKAINPVKVFLRGALFTFALSFGIVASSFAQSEANNPVTYDSTITEAANGEGPYTWNIRVTRQQSDPNQRPAIFFIPGSGEVGSNAASLLTYGPHYWLQNGWNGAVKLGNGTHYPIIISIQQPASNMRPWHLKAVLATLLKIFPIKANSVHVSGLSEGSYEWGELISYAASSGDQSSMSMIKSWVDLEGVGPGDNFSGFNAAYPGVFGTWAQKYGGRFFGLEGSMDSRNIWQITQAMNSASGNSGYFCYENIGGGAHCCWNSMFDPSVLNWSCKAPVGNGNLVPSTNPASTMGDYFYSASTGSNIFQWMLRQGDTSLVSATTAVAAPKVSAGSALTITLPIATLTLSGVATAASGATLVSVAWSKVSGPNTPVIVSVGSGITAVTGLVAGTYVFQLTAKDNLGNTGSAQVTETVLPLIQTAKAPTINAGSAQTITLPTSTVNLSATGTANNGGNLVSGQWSKVSGPNSPVFSTPTNSYTTAVSGLIAGTYVFQLSGTDNSGNTGYGQVTVTVNPAKVQSTQPSQPAQTPTQAPTVNAGTTQTIVLPSGTLTLDGVAHAATGATLVSVAWSKVSGPNTPVIASAGSGITAVTGLAAGTYVFQLTAKDNEGNSGSGQVTVLVEEDPTANAGTAQTITLPTSTVTLKGVSTAYGGAILKSVLWTKASGPNTPAIASPGSSITAITGLVAGTYVFKLTAADNNNNSGSGQVTVTVNPLVSAPKTPTVNAGSAQTITLPTSTVNLAATATANNGGNLVSGLWSELSGPNSAAFSTPTNSYTTAVSGLVAGTYIFQLTATDNTGNSGSGQVTVTVNAGSSSSTGTSSPPVPPANTALKTLIAPGEYQAFFLNESTKKLYSVGTNLRTQGVNGAGVPGTTLALDFPSNVSIQTAASGLHGGAAADANGNVWTWGDNSQGTTGNGTVTATETLVPTQIMTDANGSTFTGITALSSFYSGNAGSGWYAVKADGTLWVWGQTLGGMAGDGTAGQTTQTRPKQVPVPGGRKVAQVASGNQLIILCTDGTVWTCGGSNPNPQDMGYAATTTTELSLVQLTGLSGITQIAGGGSFNYALNSSGTLFGWGYFGFYMGGPAGEFFQLATPTNLTTALNLPHPVKQIAVSMTTSYAILTDGTLWAWGDNAQGGIGNGKELNYATTVLPYVWDWNVGDLLQQAPVQVGTRTDWAGVFAIQPYVMYVYAETTSGQIYSWGRNKGGVLGNGVVGCSSDVVADYPNSWDVTTPTAVNPLAITSPTVVASPFCVKNPNGSPCNECTIAAAANAAVQNASASLLSSPSTPEQFLVYPTLTTGTLNLRIVSDTNGTVQVAIYDINGRMVQQDQLEKENTWLEKSYNVGRLSSGMYIMQVLIGDRKRMVTKFIKQ